MLQYERKILRADILTAVTFNNEKNNTLKMNRELKGITKARFSLAANTGASSKNSKINPLSPAGRREQPARWTHPGLQTPFNKF